VGTIRPKQPASRGWPGRRIAAAQGLRLTGTLDVVATSIDELLSDDFLSGIDGLSMSELRQRRQACQEVETGLSFYRRLIQGRLDIIHDELSRREGGGEAGLGDLIERLPSILADASAGAPARGPLPEVIAPSDVVALSRQLDGVVDAQQLATLSSQPLDEVRALADRLTGLERTVSQQRRGLHERIDALQDEIVRRYKSGEASVDALLR
jgi:hypothetical protein